MFSIDESRRVETDVHKIVSDHDDILWHDGPILWVGKNKYGNWVLAVSVDEDYEKKIERHFALHILDWMYKAYKKGEYTYRHFMQCMNQVYTIDVSWETGEEIVYELRFNDIPEDYLPTKDSFHPDIVPTEKAKKRMEEDYDEFDRLQGRLSLTTTAVKK